MVRFMRYQGSKIHFVDKFNNLVKNINEDVYIEPFIGSGAIFFNLKKKFKKYIINDLNEHIISIYKSFRDIDYNDYLQALDFIEKEFGNIKECKECYYNFRNWYNKNYHFTNKIEKGIYLHILSGSCINSILRFGPNGMNTSFGKRFFKLDEDAFNKIKEKLKNTIIENMDYKQLLEEYKIDNKIIFLDPPYFERPGPYTNNFKSKDLDEFLEYIKTHKGKIIYTDIYSDYIKEKLNWDFIETKLIRNISPNRKQEEMFQEVAFYNFESNNILEDW
jgi:DNA adenine methylase